MTKNIFQRDDDFSNIKPLIRRESRTRGRKWKLSKKGVWRDVRKHFLNKKVVGS